MPGEPWRWDPSLYAGSAAFYPTGRVAYPPELAERLSRVLRLDGAGRLLDVGCGPGSLTLPLAPLFAEVDGVDADGDMLEQADRLARAAGIGNITWHHLRAEELPAHLAAPDVVAFAQSFHWMDRRHVADSVRTMLNPGGVVVHVGATTHQGVETADPLPHPHPPRRAIGELLRRYLGPSRRAGRSVLATGTTAEGEDGIYRGAGFTGPERIELPGRDIPRSAAEIRASVYSLSSAAPHLFGARFEDFDADLRAVLARGSPDGTYSERFRGITLSIWRD